MSSEQTTTFKVSSLILEACRIQHSIGGDLDRDETGGRRETSVSVFEEFEIPTKYQHPGRGQELRIFGGIIISFLNLIKFVKSVTNESIPKNYKIQIYFQMRASIGALQCLTETNLKCYH